VSGGAEGGAASHVMLWGTVTTAIPKVLRPRGGVSHLFIRTSHCLHVPCLTVWLARRRHTK
jgi:hypothetical protein